MGNIYEPAEDSFFFSEFLKEYLRNKKASIKYLDVGTGSGILSKVASKYLDKEHIFSCDINPSSVNRLIEEGFNCILSDLFENVKGKFDIITFNAPYLPEDQNEPEDSRIATTGGKRGDEISVRFLKNVGKFLNVNGKVFLMISSLTPMDKIDEFNGRLILRKKIFMEELRILEFDYSSLN